MMMSLSPLFRDRYPVLYVPGTACYCTLHCCSATVPVPGTKIFDPENEKRGTIPGRVSYVNNYGKFEGLTDCDSRSPRPRSLDLNGSLRGPPARMGCQAGHDCSSSGSLGA